MDYNIYIHDKTSQTRPTQARKGGGTNTAPKSKDSSSGSYGGSFTLQSLKDSWGGELKAVGKTALVLYAIKKAADLAIKVVDTVEPFVTRETGDYRFNIAYGNIKQLLSNIRSPLRTALSAQSYYQINKLFAQKQEQERLLIGDSFLNSRTRKV